MVLSSGSVTPLQLVSAYYIFANGGYRVKPYLISRVTDNSGNVLMQFKPAALDEKTRVIDPRIVHIINDILIGKKGFRKNFSCESPT